MKNAIFLLLFVPICACTGQKSETKSISIKTEASNSDSTKIIDFFNENQTSKLSISHGTVSNGSLENGKIMPFYGSNFQYFDEESYFGARAFANHKICEIITDTYKELEQKAPNRFFYLMELSNKEGGKIFPHRTHQNGLSVDFMIPKLKDSQPYYGLDTLGKDHYFLNFTDQGEYDQDKSIAVDFNLMALHLLILNEQAKKHGYKISKVILKLEYKEHLFATENGKLLLKSGMYFAKNLTPLINDLHDDHFHVDFEKN